MTGQQIERLGVPWRVYEELGSTNDEARAWLADGAPHGAVVTAGRQTAGRGRQGRDWSSPPGALTLSVVVRNGVDGLLPLRAGLSVARVAGTRAQIKWPNDVLVDGRKVAGVLVELIDDAAIVGIGVNVAVEVEQLPPEVAARAGSLGRDPDELGAVADVLVTELRELLATPAADVVAQLAARDALAGRPIRWAGGEGIAAGIDASGRMQVQTDEGDQLALDGGEVHLL